MSAFFTKIFDVMIVLISHRAIAAAIDSWPAVKLRFTGTLPASDVAMFASAPPIDPGSSRPTFDSFGMRRRIHRDSTRLATRTLPNVIVRPDESAMQKEK